MTHSETGRDAAPDFSNPAYFINRELSWLAFNHRVLEEGLDTANPLLERLKFLAIVSSNLDEFFMVRVAGLKDLVKAGVTKLDASGMTPAEQLSEISTRVHSMVRDQYRLWSKELFPALKQEGIQFLSYSQLDEDQRKFAADYFEHTIYPVLTPMAVDQGRPFPLLLNRSLNLGVLLEPIDDPATMRFAVVQVPTSVLPRILPLPAQNSQEKAFIFLEEIIKGHAEALFHGHHIRCINAFRITRNADLTLDEEGAEDLLEMIEKELRRRKWGAAVRLEIEEDPCRHVEEILVEALELKAMDIYEVPGPIDFTPLLKFSFLPGFDHLRNEPLDPQPAQDFVNEEDLFAAIARRDIMLHLPYESFDPVVQFVKEAARDPKVLAIKQTLYRVSGDSPIVKSLAEAANNGKQVTVLVELKARFDEENNIQWAKMLEQAGCHVIYGLVGLKVHAKITLIVRQEDDGIRRYVHLSTGNYNDSTARLYTDLGMFTANPRYGADASAFFNEVSGFSNPAAWHKLAVAPHGMRKKFYALIKREMEHSTPEKPGRIRAKINSLTDPNIIKALYEASSAGVQIELLIRGICCLKPGIPGVSDNICVTSIIDRFLEHHRIFYFQNGGEEEIYLSSADWMSRNLDRRVELLFPVEAPKLKERVKEILDIAAKDNVKTRILAPNSVYTRVESEGEPLQSQIVFHQLATERAKPNRSIQRILDYV